MAGAGHRSLHLNNGRMMTMMGEGPQRAARGIHEKKTKKRDGDIFQCQQAKGTFVGTTEPRECVIYVGEMSRAKVHFGNYNNNNNIIIFLRPAFFIFVALCVMLSFSFFFVLLLALLARRHIERVCVCAQLTSAMHSPGLEGGLFPPYHLEFHGMWWPA